MCYEKSIFQNLRCRQALSKLVQHRKDPTISIQWCPETTGTWTMAKVTIWTPFYESCSKYENYVKSNFIEYFACFTFIEVLHVWK